MLLTGKLCDFEGKINKYKGNHPTLEENLPGWKEILQGKKYFFQAWPECRTNKSLRYCLGKVVPIKDQCVMW